MSEVFPGPTMKHVHVRVDDPAQSDYLAAAARIRRTSVNALIHEVVRTVLQDQMIAAILDDQDQPKPLPKKRPKREKVKIRCRAA